MPPNIKKANEIKIAIDDKANLIELDDEADGEERPTEPDFCFDIDPDASFYGDGDGVQLAANTTAGGAATEGSFGTDESVAPESIGSSRSSNLREFKELLASPLVLEGAYDAARTPRPAHPSAAPCTGRAGSGGVSKARAASHETLAANTAQTHQQQSARLLASRREADKYPKLQNYSNRLGGQDLSTFRGTIGVKRGNEDDKETSFAKAMRIRAMATTTARKPKLAGREASASNMGGSLLEMLLLLREENERKAEERRAVEEKRRREDAIAQEARFRAEKTEAEERRRQKKVKRDERARRDHVEARARTQELVMIIGALTKSS
ncbi:unnamed protein product [Phytophthora fragariaefolia]|uniref:Unnamed protein product n=1 Tax=Phytophthora fragariaefolia TaxID=1490495 RepID=A0A9W6U783_9STRA|nr:unnamed protein product [Phytophthora fragariaefolia]